MNNVAVMVPLDGTTDSLRALPVARSLAKLENGVVHIVHVAQRIVPTDDLIDQLGLDAEELEGTVLDPCMGPPAEAIVRLATTAGARLIVLSTHTAALRGDVIGSTALAVVRTAPCPVVLVRPETAPMTWTPKSILVGHDGRPCTSAAIPPAAELAIRSHAKLEILHTTGIQDHPSREPGSMTLPRYLDQPQHEWPVWATEFVRRFLTESSLLKPAQVRLALAHGVPGDEIIRYAEQHSADMIVLAWRGDFAAEHAQTVKAVLRMAPCPIMITRTEPGAFVETRPLEQPTGAPQPVAGATPAPPAPPTS